MNIWMLLAVVAMVFLVIFQIAKASEYVNVLKGEKRTKISGCGFMIYTNNSTLSLFG